MRRVLISAAILLAVGAFVVITGGSSNGPSGSTYGIELDNAFGLVNGSSFKVAGVRAGTIKSIDLCYSKPNAHCQNPLHALVTVNVTQKGFGSFRSDAFCDSRPQSLIGEYFVDCEPGQNGRTLKSGSTIPASRTQSTIPADLLQDVMRMPYRERFSLIINELGAAVASRSEDLQTALRRAVPALTETDNLLNLLANDSNTIKALNVNADAVITALANNSSQVQRFIVEADKAATATATQDRALAATWQKLPGFLEQLRPTMVKLGAAADANEPVLANLNASAGQLDRFFNDVVPFSHAALPSLQSLGKASVTGKVAVEAARPTVHHLNQFAKPTPELAQNLAIVGHDLDDQSRAVEPDPRSPGGRGFSGLQALLWYVFNQTLAINTFGPFGHQLSVDGFASLACSPYATQQSVASGLRNFGPSYRDCYSWYGPNQPGINEPDPSKPGACVPDPGGHPPYGAGASAGACKLNPPAAPLASPDSASSQRASGGGQPSSGSSPAAPAGSSGSSASGGGGSSPPVPSGVPPVPGAGGLRSALGSIVSALGGHPGGANVPAPAASSAASSSGGSWGAGGQAQQLLSYLLSP